MERHDNESVHQSLGYETLADWYFSGIAEAA